ncbi:5-methylcytosine rRNA methyltransferase nsun4 [Plakobranchus ocellatus]|uniref:NOL1/NOP2/Sun domain family member 4 n=1 Tax=Plakobranchus ocellatus TaxID=259542 RepID=A0AAV4B876_9GAST|nr:5-methylcytosine rRNA methyltransferase nsun4 [Plakobranchus ocellatus]
MSLSSRNFLRLLWVYYKQCHILTTKRFRYKPKWAYNEKPLKNCEQALGNFDAFYKPFYRKDWPSIRVSLLSLPKHCAAVNKYGNVEKIQEQLCDIGAEDFLLSADVSVQNEAMSDTSVNGPKQNATVPESSSVNFHTQLANEEAVDAEGLDMSQRNLLEDGFGADQHSNDDLNMFVPTEKVYSERDLLLREEISLNSFESREISLSVLPADPLNFSPDVGAFVFQQGDVSRFPSPKPHHGCLGYYLMDAASVLPVLALDVQPDDRVLDLCAAPGGKSYLILQALDLHGGGKLHCNDVAQARISRLKNVLRLHFPQDISERVTITKMNGTSTFPTIYNKVLVDVPCNADRHAVTEDENNLFKISRTKERLGLTQIQKNLLISAIKSCVPGGTIVYSTCTLSPAQNDGVIQAVAEELWETSEIEIAVQDLNPLRHSLSRTFRFHDRSQYGLTVLPTLLNNFGPSYVSKLRRLK